MSKPRELSYMTKDRLMTYTFVALLIIAVITIVMWWDVYALDVATMQPIGWQYGLTVLINCLIAVGIAVGIDALLYKVASDSPLNLMSAAVFGLIVSLSYTIGEPVMRVTEVLPLLGPDAFVYVAFITAVGMVLFKKIQGLKGRKYVNPAAAAKLIVLGFVGLLTILIPVDHLVTGGLQVPSLAGPINYDLVPGNGVAGFGFYLVGCFGNPATPIPATIPTQNDVFNLFLIGKFHAWAGGASSLAVIIVGIALFALLRRYIKWRITVAYFVSVAMMAAILHFAYPGGDLLLRLGFELFMGSSIFLAFFMATDPATTPLTNIGQIIFGIGLGVLTVLIQTYIGFLGGSILALVIMNLTTPFLDNIGWMPISEGKCERRKMPKAKVFTTVKTTECIRCGACMRVCCHNLSAILVKEAFEKGDVKKLKKLRADLCEGCGHCVYVCPAKINIRATNLRASASLRKEK